MNITPRRVHSLRIRLHTRLMNKQKGQQVGAWERVFPEDRSVGHKEPENLVR